MASSCFLASRMRSWTLANAPAAAGAPLSEPSFPSETTMPWRTFATCVTYWAFVSGGPEE